MQLRKGDTRTEESSMTAFIGSPTAPFCAAIDDGEDAGDENDDGDDNDDDEMEVVNLGVADEIKCVAVVVDVVLGCRDGVV